eukprot:6490463-Amphidinium_carterae.1
MGNKNKNPIYVGALSLHLEQLKAAEIKHLVPVAVSMAGHLLSKTDEKEQLITALLTQSCLIDEILGYTKELFVLDADAAESLRDAILQFNILATELRFRFDATMLFHFTVKNHALCHVAEDCTNFHPRSEGVKTYNTLIIPHPTHFSIHLVLRSRFPKVMLELHCRGLHADCENISIWLQKHCPAQVANNCA